MVMLFATENIFAKEGHINMHVRHKTICRYNIPRFPSGAISIVGYVQAGKYMRMYIE